MRCGLFSIRTETSCLLTVFAGDSIILHGLINDCVEEADVILTTGVCATLGAFLAPVVGNNNSESVVNEVHLDLTIDLSRCAQ